MNVSPSHLQSLLRSDDYAPFFCPCGIMYKPMCNETGWEYQPLNRITSERKGIRSCYFHDELFTTIRKSRTSILGTRKSQTVPFPRDDRRSSFDHEFIFAGYIAYALSARSGSPLQLMYFLFSFRRTVADPVISNDSIYHLFIPSMRTNSFIQNLYQPLSLLHSIDVCNWLGVLVPARTRSQSIPSIAASSPQISPNQLHLPGPSSCYTQMVFTIDLAD